MAKVLPSENKWAQSQKEPLFVAVPRNDPEMVMSVELARRSISQFIQWIETDTSHLRACSAKLGFRDPIQSERLGEDRFAFLWVTSITHEQGAFAGRISGLPATFNWLHQDQVVTFHTADLQDWMVLEEGHLYGGYSLRVQRRRIPEAHRPDYDRYLGVTTYEPLP